MLKFKNWVFKTKLEYHFENKNKNKIKTNFLKYPWDILSKFLSAYSFNFNSKNWDLFLTNCFIANQIKNFGQHTYFSLFFSSLFALFIIYFEKLYILVLYSADKNTIFYIIF